MASKGKFHIPSLDEMETTEDENLAVRSLFNTRKTSNIQQTVSAEPVVPSSAQSTVGSSATGIIRTAAVPSVSRPQNRNNNTDQAGSSVPAPSLGGSSAPGLDQLKAKSSTAAANKSASMTESNVQVTVPKPVGKSVSIVVNSRQRGNPILKSIRSVPWEFGDIVPDYELGQTSCALFLSLRYHCLNPNYIHQRLQQLAHSYELRILLVQVDVKDPHHSLKELAKMCILVDCTLILAFSAEEAGRYLETYKAFENKPPDLIKEKTEGNYLAKVTDMFTSVKKVNKTDASTLLSTFGTVADIVNASEEDLSLCPGFGPQKARRLHEVMNEPFLKKKKLASSPRKASSTSSKPTQTKPSSTEKSSPLKQFLVKPSTSADSAKGSRIAHKPKVAEDPT